MASHADGDELGDCAESVLGARARHPVLHGRGRGGIGVSAHHGAHRRPGGAMPAADADRRALPVLRADHGDGRAHARQRGRRRRGQPPGLPGRCAGPRHRPGAGRAARGAGRGAPAPGARRAPAARAGGGGTTPEGAAAGGYGSPAGGYANPPGAYPPGPAGYGNPGYGNVPAPGGYGAPQGYGGPQGYGSPDNYANWLQRVGAYLIDVIPIAVLEGIGLATRSTPVYFLFFLPAIRLSAHNRWFQAGKTRQSWG